MPLFLNVPYAQKEQAKAAGARWNPEVKKWYVSDRRNYHKCLAWIDGDAIICNQIYIVEGMHTCFRCQRPTRVVGFAFETFYELGDDTMEYFDDEIHIGYINSKLPEALAAELQKRYNYFWGYSNTTKSYTYGNHCQNPACGVLQGNWFVFDEVDSPFFIDGPRSAGKLTLRRITLPNDIAVHASIGYGSEDRWIKARASIVDSDLTWA